MKRIKCAYCGFVAFSNDEFCKKCLQVLVDAADVPPPVKFGVPTGTGNGCGISLIDYQKSGDGIFKVMKWIVVLYIPIIPLSAWEIAPQAFESQIPGMVDSYKFNVIGKAPLNLLRVLRVWAINVISLAPMVAVFYSLLRFDKLLRNSFNANVFIVVLLAVILGSFFWLFALQLRFVNNGSEKYSVG